MRRFNVQTTSFFRELLIHLFVWLVLYFLPLALSYGTDTTLEELIFHFWLQLTFIAVIFYINYLLLVQKYLFARRSTIRFFIYNLILLCVMIAVKDQIFLTYVSGAAVGHGPPQRLAWFMDFLLYLIPLAMSVGLRSAKRDLKIDALKAEAENLRLQAELQQLKYQFQPHFIFNALNNVYGLIEIDPAQAQCSLHSLSKLIRLFLQTSESRHIPLKDELDFLLQYINVAKLRLSTNVHVHVDFPKNIPAILIAPHLLLTAVENAFKHGVPSGEMSSIHFQLRIENNRYIRFIASNRLFEKQQKDQLPSGTGLVNLRKRLQLLYAGEFKLNHYSKHNHYFFNLKIPIA